MKLIPTLLLFLIPCALLALDTGFELPDEYAERAKDGIERHRKSYATIRVLDSEGMPVEDARLEIRQTSHDFLFGCAFPSWNIDERKPSPEVWEKFEHHFLKLFNYATTENMLKWQPLERTRGDKDYRMTDAFVNWGEKNDIAIKGHCLVWGWTQGHPRWLEELSPEEIAKETEAHVREVVSRYKGRIDIWDVVNEPLDRLWFEENMSPDYAVKALKWAREANPDAQIIVNEYGTHFGDRANRFVDHCRGLIEQGAPLDAIGEQAHCVPRIPSPSQMFDSLDTLASLGKDVHITEITFPSNGADIASDFVQGTWTPEIQAKYYRYYYTLAFSHPSVKAITIWAMWDGSSWLDQGGIISRDWTPKPAYHELDSLINKEWRTNRTGVSRGDGMYRFRGFHGEYEVKVTVGNKEHTATVHVAERGRNVHTISIP